MEKKPVYLAITPLHKKTEEVFTILVALKFILGIRVFAFINSGAKSFMLLLGKKKTPQEQHLNCLTLNA